MEKSLTLGTNMVCVFYLLLKETMCMIKAFIGGGGGGGRGGGWGGGSSKRCLKWGGGRWVSLRDLSKNRLKQGWVKAKVVCRGRGF